VGWRSNRRWSTSPRDTFQIAVAIDSRVAVRTTVDARFHPSSWRHRFRERDFLGGQGRRR
jgi:hypothetical protein